MDLLAILLANGTGIFILLLLVYVSHARTKRHRLEDRLFTFMIAGVGLACFMEALSYAIDGHLFPGARPINYVANTYLYSVNMLLPFSVLAYVDLGLYGNPARIWANYKPQIIIGCIMFCANVVNFFIPITYKISANNVYARMPFSYVYYFVILYYCISAVIVTRRYHKEYGARDFFSIGVFLFPILTGAALQFMFYGLSLAWLAAAIGLSGLFMMQQNEMAYIDALTDTYNRQYMDIILASWAHQDRGFFGVMIDVDHFKHINDTWGHKEGDDALRCVADVLKRARHAGELVFRFAGDEFIVLRKGDDQGELVTYMERVESLLERGNTDGSHPYQLELSWGLSHYEAGNVDAFIGDMDEHMYQMKERHHAEDVHSRTLGNARALVSAS